MSRDDHDDAPEPRAPFPGGVKAAGIIWIGYGALGLLSAAVNFVTGAAAAAGGGPEATGRICGVGCIVLFALAFLVVGIQTVRGTAKDVLGNGVGSILFSVLYFGLAAFLLVGGLAAGAANPPPGKGGAPADPNTVRTVALITGGMVGFFGLLLLLAGVLALSNRTAYKEWRRAAGVDRSRRRDRDEFEDDRDRRRQRDEGDRSDDRDR